MAKTNDIENRYIPEFEKYLRTPEPSVQDVALLYWKRALPAGALLYRLSALPTGLRAGVIFSQDRTVSSARRDTSAACRGHRF